MQIQIRFGLRMKNEQELEDYFWNVSTPGHALYGKHLTRNEANVKTRVDAKSLSQMYAWLLPYNQSRIHYSHDTNILQTRLSSEWIEKTLQTKIMTIPKKQRRLSLKNPIVYPQDMKHIITFTQVFPEKRELKRDTNPSPPPRRLNQYHHQSPNGRKLQTGQTEITPHFIRNLYGIPENARVSNETNSQGIAEFFTESWSPQDLALFRHEFNLSGTPHIVQLGDRKNSPSFGTSEAELDLQLITGLAPGVATTFVWSMQGENPHSALDEPFIKWATSVLEMEHPPHVISLSYSDDEKHIFASSAEYARAFDVLLIKMGTRGISVLMASGDDGVAGQRPSIEHLSGDDRCAQSGPQWPTGSPYITAVGATMHLSPKDSISGYLSTRSEVVCSGVLGGQITSGGGFSNQYGTPAYQQPDVQNYIRQHTSHIPPEYFNRNGRGYPDLSAYGSKYSVFLNGYKKQLSGTSASTPVVAAMVTLWNDRRLNSGKTPLGFLNPILYRIASMNASAFHDIVVGSNGASQQFNFVCPYAFDAAVGWDATTGLGTPNFPILDELLFNAETIGMESNNTTTHPFTNSTPTIIISHYHPPLSSLAIFTMMFGWLILFMIMVITLYRKLMVSTFLPIPSHELTEMKETMKEKETEKSVKTEEDKEQIEIEIET